ncbi:MAG: 23S rRNA (pseudouridine(1915)-N(3))-methyltransferase RlmH [Alphaproteobacteria bacterium]|nr:23S rRNA (pseudouridine(1915)-N(3))-methyltransferase RlmH [Alphaproteobacteria bacterium]
MLKIEIICVSKLRKGSFYDIAQDYQKRLQWTLTIREFDSAYKTQTQIQKDEEEKILSALNSRAVIIALDERGKSFKSVDFAQRLEKYAQEGRNEIQFIIGGAYGLTDAIRQKAELLISFGEQTWPHLMVRTMLLEQIYRSQQILAGHPYHKE